MRDQSVSANTARGMQCVQLVAYVPRGTRGGKMDSAVRHRPCVPITADACCQHGGSSIELGDRRGRMEGRALGPWDRMGCESRVPLPGPVLFLLVSSSSSSSTPLSEALLHSASQAASPACAVPVSSFRGCPRNQRCKAFTSLFWETLLSTCHISLSA